ncbi:hypothetical protein ACSQ67_017971 [Phaseolus vulgaris]
MLLTPEGDTSVEDLIKDNKEWLEEIFDEITPWDNSVRVARRRVWVRVWGLPFHLWEWSVFVNVVINIGNLLAVDKTTENFDELQYARVLVSIPFVAEARTSKRMMINETIYQIRIEEDLTCCDKSNERKENEVSWSESFVGDEESESNYDNASESEKLMPTNQNMKSEFNHIGISPEMMSEDRYDSPVLRDVRKAAFRHRGPRLSVSCPVWGTGRWEKFAKWARCLARVHPSNDALHVIPNVHGSSTTRGDSGQMRNGPRGANSVQMLEEGGEGDNPLVQSGCPEWPKRNALLIGVKEKQKTLTLILMLYSPCTRPSTTSDGRHEREDEALMIGGAATRTQTGRQRKIMC